MKNKNIIAQWMAGVSLILFSSLLQAGQPLWTFTPVAGFPPTVSVATGETATIKYTMTNQSSKTHTLAMTPIAGITQLTTSGNCSNPFTLGNHQSCTLTLQVDGSSLPGNIIGGPQVCQQGSPLQCYQPSFADVLRITKVANNTAGITAAPTALALTAYSQTPGYITITNTSTTITATNVEATLPSNWTDVTEYAGQCASIAPSGSCQLSFTPGTNAYAPQSVLIKGTNTDTVTVMLSVDAPSFTTLTASLPTLALSANGNPRQVIITNAGSSPAYNVDYTISPALPSGTTISPASCGTINSGATCVLTITPGATADNTPSVLTVQAINTWGTTTDLYVLTFGSIYQQGYLFAIDDTTATDGSISGNNASLADNSSGIQWYNGSFVATGATDINAGSQNSALIISTQDAGSYAASLCANYTIDSAGNSPCSTGTCYSDWYLPAICQMGPDSGSTGCAVGTPNMVDNLPSLTNGCTGAACLDGAYWSSTEFAPQPSNTAWLQLIASGSSTQLHLSKNNLFFVRCIRNITP